MKKVGLFALVTAAMLAALVIYSLSILGEYERLEKKLADEYVAGAKGLQALDESYPKPASALLDARRFAAWFTVRTTIAELLAERLKDPKQVTQYQVRQTRNMALAKLAEALAAQSMGISEYCAVSARWRALLARPEFAESQARWRAVVRTQSNPEGMTLPPPATNATPEEIAMVKSNLAQLEATMDADKLAILLDRIAGGEIPEGVQNESGSG